MQKRSKNLFYRKLQLSFIAFLILPILIISVFNYTIYKEITLEKVNLSNESVLNVVSNDINKTINDIFYASQMLVNDTNVVTGLTELQDSDRINNYNDFKNFTQLVEYLSVSEMKALNQSVDIFIVNNNDFIIPSIRNSKSVPELKDDWGRFKNTINHQPQDYFNWIGSVENGQEAVPNDFYFTKAIINPTTKEKLGMLNIVIRGEYFQNLFDQITVGSIIITDQDDQLIYGVDSAVSVEKEGVLKDEVTLSRLEWKMVYFTPQSQLTTELKTTFYQSLLFSGVFAVIFIIISIVLANKMHLPIKRLQEVTQRYGDGDRAVRYDLEGNDELNRLGKMINNTFDQIEDLIENIEHEKDKKKELEIKALFSQIRPHFLMNTLNSIRCNLAISGDTYHSNKIYSLTLLLRKYVNANKPSTLLNECELLEHYVDIMSMRNGIDFSLEFLIPKQFETLQLPFLTLQPIVENAIVHGFTRGENGTISICATEEEHKLVIRITDDGIGITREKCQQINDNLVNNQTDNQTENSPIGLINIKQRLQMIYGETSSVYIESDEGYGTTVEVTLPLNNEHVL
ncbi:MAG: cache domain-containing sensor histidine kinase [Bacillota bacterium]